MSFSLRDNVNVAVVCIVKTNTTINATFINVIDECVPELKVTSHYNDVSNVLFMYMI